MPKSRTVEVTVSRKEKKRNRRYLFGSFFSSQFKMSQRYGLDPLKKDDLDAPSVEILQFNEDLVKQHADRGREIEELNERLSRSCTEWTQKFIAQQARIDELENEIRFKESAESEIARQLEAQTSYNAVAQAQVDKDVEWAQIRDNAVAQARVDKDAEWAQTRDDAVEACRTACNTQHAAEINHLKHKNAKATAKKVAHCIWNSQSRSQMNVVYNKMKSKVTSLKLKSAGEITSLKEQIASKEETITDLEDTVAIIDVELKNHLQTVSEVDLKEKIKKHDDEMLVYIERLKTALKETSPDNKLEGRDQLLVRDLTHSMMHNSIELRDPEQHIFISDVMLQMGYKFDRDELALIGNPIKSRFLQMFGRRPTKHTQFMRELLG